MDEVRATSILALTRRQAVWLYVLLSGVFVAVMHVASDPAWIPLWARRSPVTVLCSFAVVGVIMFGRKDIAKDFLRSTAIISVWTLTIFAAVVFASPICLYASLVPLLIQIVLDCISNRDSAGKTFIVLWSVWFSTGVIFTLLIHGPFDDIALGAKLSSISWYLDIRVLLTLILCVFILFHALLAAYKSPTRRLIREIEMVIDPPDGAGLVHNIIHGLINAINDLLLRHLSQFINILTGFVSAVLCYIAATGLEIGQFILHHVINFALFGIMLRRIAVFALLLLLALAIPTLADGTLAYVRTSKVFAHIWTPILDILLALFGIILIQLLQPISADYYIQRAGRAAFFLLCVLFSAKTIAFALSYIPHSSMLYARNLDAIYIAMLIGIAVAFFVGIRRKKISPNMANQPTQKTARLISGVGRKAWVR